LTRYAHQKSLRAVRALLLRCCYLLRCSDDTEHFEGVERNHKSRSWPESDNGDRACRFVASRSIYPSICTRHTCVDATSLPVRRPTRRGQETRDGLYRRLSYTATLLDLHRHILGGPSPDRFPLLLASVQLDIPRRGRTLCAGYQICSL
jgi:hypothetical protein